MAKFTKVQKQMILEGLKAVKGEFNSRAEKFNKNNPYNGLCHVADRLSYNDVVTYTTAKLVKNYLKHSRRNQIRFYHSNNRICSDSSFYVWKNEAVDKRNKWLDTNIAKLEKVC